MKCFNKLKADYAVLLSFISCMFLWEAATLLINMISKAGQKMIPPILPM